MIYVHIFHVYVYVDLITYMYMNICAYVCTYIHVKLHMYLDICVFTGILKQTIPEATDLDRWVALASWPWIAKARGRCTEQL